PFVPCCMLITYTNKLAVACFRCVGDSLCAGHQSNRSRKGLCGLGRSCTHTRSVDRARLPIASSTNTHDTCTHVCAQLVCSMLTTSVGSKHAWALSAKITSRNVSMARSCEWD